MHGVGVTVISFARHRRRRRGHRVGQRQRQRDRRRSPRSSRPPTPRRGPAPRPRTWPTWSRGSAAADWDDAPGETDIHVYDAFAPALGEAFGRAEAGGRVLYGFVNHGVTTTYLGSSTGLRLRHVQPTGHYGCTGKTADRGRSAWVGGATRDFAEVDALALRRDARAAARLGRAPGRPAGGPLRHDPAAALGGRPDDRRLLVRRRPHRPRGPVGLQQARRGAPASASRSPGTASTCSPIRPTPAWSARPS